MGIFLGIADTWGLFWGSYVKLLNVDYFVDFVLDVIVYQLLGLVRVARS